MRTRYLIHYLDGKTYKEKWDKYLDPDALNVKAISSLQLQEEEGVIYTLSSKSKTIGNFKCKESDQFRSILRRIDNDIWLELRLYPNEGKTEIEIIEEKKYA
jgi:hypothetical protein